MSLSQASEAPRKRGQPPKAPNQRKAYWITFRCRPALRSKLGRLASTEGQSISQYAEAIIIKVLEGSNEA